MEVKEEIVNFNCDVKRSQRQKRSSAWDGFIPSADGTSAVCKICNARVKTKNGVTSGMKGHLGKVHVVSYGLVKELTPKKAKEKVQPKVRKVSNLNMDRPKITRRRRSVSWKYFTLQPGGTSAVCKLCSKLMKVTAGGTSGLLTHIQSYHKTLTESEELFLQQKLELESESERKPVIKVKIKRKVKRNVVPSVAWKYFNRATDNLTAECKMCGKVMKTSHGVTSGLLNHLAVFHRDQVKHEWKLFPPSSRNPHSSALVKRGLKRVRRLTSPAWKWFRPDPSWKFATCKLCEKNIKTFKGATTGLTLHVIAYHSAAIRSSGKRRAKSDQDRDGVKKAKLDTDPDLDHSIEQYEDTESEPAESRDRSNRDFRRARRSIAWKYFSREADKSSAKCKICGKVMKTSHGATSGLRSHLAAFHRDKVKHERSLNLSPSNSSVFQPRGLKGRVRRLRSEAWQWFRPDPSWKFATCKLCGKNIKTIKGATTGLMKHVIAFHMEAIKTSRNKNKGAQNCLEEEEDKTANSDCDPDPDPDPDFDDDDTFNYEDIEAEPFASTDAARLSQCFLCHSTIKDRAGPLTSSSSSISKQLHVIFLLSKILQIPRETLEAFLKSSGNPQDWIKLCNHCDAKLDGAKKIYQELLKAGQKFRDVRKSMIKEVRERFPFDCSSGADASSSITGKCLNYLKNCDYGHFTDPFIAGDLKASEKLKISKPQIKIEPEDIIKQEVDSDSNFENCYDDEAIHDFEPQLSQEEEKRTLRSSRRIQNQSQQEQQLGDEEMKFKDFSLESYQSESESEDASSLNDHDDQDFAVEGSESDFVIEEEVEECQESPKISKEKVKDKRSQVLKKNVPSADGCIPAPPVLVICPLCKIRSFAANRGDELCQHLDECSQSENQTESLFEFEKGFTLRCPVCSTFEATIHDKVCFAEHMGACCCGDTNSGTQQTQIPLSKRLFSCDICPEKKYLRFEDFLIHWLFHKKNVYKCTICEKTFQHKELITSHMASDHSNDPGITTESPGWTICSPTLPTLKWWCPLCNEIFLTGDTRDDHVRNFHPDSQLLSNQSGNEKYKQCECDWCEKQFSSEDELSLHSATVHFTLRNLCEICNLHFPGETPLRYHRIEVHGVKFLYTCHLCDAEIPSNPSLSKHATVHAKSRMNGRVCPICHKVFHNAGRVNSHIRLVHENGSSFSCNVVGCGMEFRNIHRLTFHKASAHKIGKFKCTVENCDNVFARPYLLEQHVARVHTKEFRFFCAVCGEGFYNSSSWKKHEKYAHVPPSFICDICGKAFKTKENLKQHQGFHKPKSAN